MNLEYPYSYENVEDMASKYLSEEQIKIIRKAYEFAKVAHEFKIMRILYTKIYYHINILYTIIYLNFLKLCYHLI